MISSVLNSVFCIILHFDRTLQLLFIVSALQSVILFPWHLLCHYKSCKWSFNLFSMHVRISLLTRLKNVFLLRNYCASKLKKTLNEVGWWVTLRNKYLSVSIFMHISRMILKSLSHWAFTLKSSNSTCLLDFF